MTLLPIALPLAHIAFAIVLLFRLWRGSPEDARRRQFQVLLQLLAAAGELIWILILEAQ